MTEILNDRGRARAGGTQASHEFDGRTRCAPENEWRERSTSAKPTGGMCDDTFAVAVDLPHLKTKRMRASQKFDGRTRCAPENAGEPERAAQACLQPNAIGENAIGENAGENAGFDDSARSAEAP